MSVLKFHIKKLIVIHVQNPHGERSIWATELQGNKQKVSHGPKESFADIAEVFKKYGKYAAYFLWVEGKGVLNRVVADEPGFKESLIVNGETNAYEFTCFSDGEKVAVSFYNKALLKDIWELVLNEKIFLVGTAAGDAILFNELAPNDHFYANHYLAKRDGKIAAFERRDNTNIWDESLIYRAFLSAVNGDQEVSDENLKRTFQNYKDYNQFKWTGILALGILFCIVFGNYFYTNHLNQTIVDLEAEIAQQNNMSLTLSRLTQEETRKMQLVSSSGINTKAYLSFYADKIGKSVPKEIQLYKLDIFPWKAPLKEHLKVEINQDQILISGETKSSEILDIWMDRLNRFAWVKSVEITSFNRQENGLQVFNLLIQVQP